jgi:protein-S-isoprenylcysteine O-methyltransferase Ste14
MLQLEPNDPSQALRPTRSAPHAQEERRVVAAGPRRRLTLNLVTPNIKKYVILNHDLDLVAPRRPQAIRVGRAGTDGLTVSATAGAALVVYFIWFVLAFGVRMLVQYQRTGDSGWRGLLGRVGSAEWSAGVLFSVALVVGVLGPVTAIAGVAKPFDSLSLRWVGLLVAVFGVVGTLAAQLSMRDSWRIGVDRSESTELRTSEAFAVVRNPIFSAMVMTAVGLTAMVPNIVAFAGLAALAISVELQVRVVEEPYLRTIHGDAYTQYERRVGRFFPKIRPDG